MSEEEKLSGKHRKRPSGSARRKRGTLARREANARKRKLWINAVAILATSGIVSMTLIWVLAFIRYNVSSNSMAPTLAATMGRRDRVLCWKLAFRTRKPRRWEIVAFRAPANAANRDIMPGFGTGGETGMTVKRIAGLPGERIAIAGGDVWTRPPTGDHKHVRQVKPDAVQRQMWINVFRQEGFPERMDAFSAFWSRVGGGEIALKPEGILSLRPGADRAGLRFIPVTRRGLRGENLVEMPGISDRYVLMQEVAFICRNPDCGHRFEVEVDNPCVVAVCPACSWLNTEERVGYYGFRSGLSEIGEFYIGDVPQSDSKHSRAIRYNFVHDLRIDMEVRFSSPNAVLRLELTGGPGPVSALVGPGALSVNGAPASGDAPRVGEWTRVEFYRVDGAVRLFVGSDKNARFDRILYEESKPEPGRREQAKSGASFDAGGGEVDVRNLRLDRDVYYFGGRAYAIRNYMGAMDENNESVMNDNQFFPLGDNATVSLDGRSWGPVDMELLRGSVVMILSPAERRKILAVPPE